MPADFVRATAVWGIVLLLSAGCSILDRSNDADRLAIHNKNLTLVTGDTSTLAVVLGNGVPPVSTSSSGFGGNLEAIKRIQWRIRDTSVATVDARGVMTATRAGVTYAFASIDEAVDSTRLAVVAPSAPHPEFISIGAGLSHACALVASGAIHCWGSNYLGELGQGTTERFVLTVSPTAVSAQQFFVLLAVGYYHNCGLTSEGFAYCWGENVYGQLGRSSPTRSGSPIRVETPHRFVSLSAGAHRTCGVTTSKTVVCWGQGLSAPVEFSAQIEGGYVAVSVGSEHQCALAVSGRASCWGGNAYGELGNGSTVPATAPTNIASTELFASVSAGGNYTCAVTTRSEAFCWGHGSNGKLGNGSANTTSVPTRVAGNLSFRELDTGSNHTCARTTSGTAYCWGADALEALGNGENIPDQKEYLSLIPSAVQSAQQFDHIVASPDDFSCGITAARQAFCWGTNRIGTLGIGSVSRNGNTISVRAFPVPVAKFLHR